MFGPVLPLGNRAVEPVRLRENLLKPLNNLDVADRAVPCHLGDDAKSEASQDHPLEQPFLPDIEAQATRTIRAIAIGHTGEESPQRSFVLTQHPRDQY